MNYVPANVCPAYIVREQQIVPLVLTMLIQSFRSSQYSCLAEATRELILQKTVNQLHKERMRSIKTIIPSSLPRRPEPFQLLDRLQRRRSAKISTQRRQLFRYNILYVRAPKDSLGPGDNYWPHDELVDEP